MKIHLLHPITGELMAIHNLDDLDLCKEIARELGVQIVITREPR